MAGLCHFGPSKPISRISSSSLMTVGGSLSNSMSIISSALFIFSTLSWIKISGKFCGECGKKADHHTFSSNFKEKTGA